MSAYLTTTFTPLASCPARLVLDAVQRVLMRGVPDYGLTSAPWEAGTIPAEDGSWLAPSTPSPAGHYFLPAGVRLFRSDLPDEVRGDNLTIHQDQNASRRSEEDPRFWLVPIEIQLLWTRQCSGPDQDLLCRVMEQFLTEGFIRDGIRHQARHYLSSEALHVFHVRDVLSQPVTQRDGWETRLMISMTYLCSGKYLPP